MIDELLGKRIREQRKLHGYTLETFSEKAGIAPAYLGEIERGRKTPSLPVFINILDAFGDVPADLLLCGITESNKSYQLSELTEKVKELPCGQLKLISDLIDAVLVFQSTQKHGA